MILKSQKSLKLFFNGYKNISISDKKKSKI